MPSAEDESSAGTDDGPVIPCRSVAELAVDVWRIAARAARLDAPAPVILACERATDRLAELGFRLADPTGEVYDERSRYKVVEWRGGTGAPRIAECTSPAVYTSDRLILPAEVIVEGEELDGLTDS